MRVKINGIKYVLVLCILFLLNVWTSAIKGNVASENSCSSVWAKDSNQSYRRSISYEWETENRCSEQPEKRKWNGVAKNPYTKSSVQ